MRYFFVYLLLLVGYSTSAQNFFTSFYGGFSGYQGDLQETPFSARHSHFAWGVGLLYEMNPHMFIRGDFVNGRISGNDQLGTKNRARNLKFESNISEFSLAFEYLLIDPYQYKISPYAFVGIGIFGFSPYVKEKDGIKIKLFELSTEGQGFYDDRKPYKLRQIAIPFGGGIQWAITDNKRLGIVVGIRTTFTDYLDDVSKTYVGRARLLTNRNSTAVSYAYRGDELPNGEPYPEEGTQRGNPTNRDMYMFSGLILRVRIAPKHKTREYNFKIRRAKVTCPPPL